MSADIMDALQQIAHEKNIELDYVVETLEVGLLTAAKKKYGNADNITVKLNRRSGQIDVVAKKKVVAAVADAALEIAVADARALNPDVNEGEEIDIPLPLEEFGRNAIAAAKQTLIQRVREAEREKIYNEFIQRVGEVVSGHVQQIERGNLIINLVKTEAYLPLKEQIPRERYRQGDRIRALITDVQKTARGPQIMLSRIHPDLLVRLFELEVPEIFERIIEIKAVAREPGERSKIAVSSADERIDPVGACVGMKGSRVQAIVRELNNERIDIIPYHSDPELFVSRALSPAKTLSLQAATDEHRMDIVVADDQLSLAIGKNGQNARLAAKLTGWKVNITSESEFNARKKARREEKIDLRKLAGIGDKVGKKLMEQGIDSVQTLAAASVEQLVEVEGIGEKKATKLIAQAQTYLQEAGKVPPPGEEEGTALAEEKAVAETGGPDEKEQATEE